MKCIKILHISDLHRTRKDIESIGDFKSKDVPLILKEQITSPWEYVVFQYMKIYVNTHGSFDVIACTGDLGDKGNKDSIFEGAHFMEELAKSTNVSKEYVMISPGNHDADRNDDTMFKTFNDALLEYGFTNYAENQSLLCIKGVPFFVINTCKGVNYRSVFLDKYREFVQNLDNELRSQIEKELQNLGTKYLDDFLDIPVLTNDSIDDVISKLSSNTDYKCSVLLAHHDFYPSEAVECRPYCHLLDGGKLLHKLNGLGKNALILHGHVHIPTTTVAYYPANNQSFLSTIGAGVFDGRDGSELNVIEIFVSNEGEHVLTRVHPILKNQAGLVDGKDYHFYTKYETDIENDTFKSIIKSRSSGISFQELFEKIREQKSEIKEEQVVQAVLLNNWKYGISNQKKEDVMNWIVKSCM